MSFFTVKRSYCTLFLFYLHFVLSEKGAELLECPITGGLDALKKGQMATWVAGNKVGYITTTTLVAVNKVGCRRVAIK
jgi:hypothetical protein